MSMRGTHSKPCYHAFNTRSVQRWLRKQEGRPWDVIAAELRSRLMPNTEKGHRVQASILRLVDHGDHARALTERFRWCRQLGYVDAEGQLRLYKKRPQKASKHRRIELNDFVQFHRVEDIWYEVHLEPLRLYYADREEYWDPYDRINYEPRRIGHLVLQQDAFLGIEPTPWLHDLKQWYGRDNVYATSCRRMSKEEVKARKLE